MAQPADTIVAPITGAPPAAVAWIRLSGPEAWQIAARVFPAWPADPQSHRAIYGHFVTGDDGLALPFAAGRSYTGEESVELSIHGSRASLAALVDACLAAGARMADPGEFTLRAFANGRLDLTQAEGVAATVDAQTDRQLRLANDLRAGSVSRRVALLRSELAGVQAAIEASTDFSEEIGGIDRPAALSRLDAVIGDLTSLLNVHQGVRRIAHGMTIALVGPPNVGKSSLLNQIAGWDRSIVTEIPGTTRDLVDVEVSILGLLVRLVDTAGLRETEDLVERIGVERTRQAAESADIVWQLYDAGAGWTADDQAIFDDLDREPMIIAHKSDLGSSDDRGLSVSSITREGIQELLETIPSRVPPEGATPILDRHVPLLDRARQATEAARETIASDWADDLATVHLQAAIRSLGEITGETTPPDLIERMFHDFCLGK